ncbi:putative negative acting factor [Rosellinia necatrix]|uniref:Putative negative acting factor n=1 Tax=Rosellinia necatrix TaxID=77044 RepID=A0A1W2TNC0_ROSNE|nr:putative negative acting factor [Rosellinia necatrix]
MVYCGRPSRGCQMCRARRIKCDEAKPTCGQCAKSRRQCPGYKDDFDLVFRNETKATERRAQRASKKAWAQKMEAQGPPASDAPGGITALATTTSRRAAAMAAGGDRSTVASSIKLPLEDQASCMFVSNFVLMPQDGRTVGHLDFILPLLKSEGPDSHIQHAFNACSITFLNNVKKLGDKCWDRALSEYSMALSKTNAALRDPASQQSDATLAAVLLLGMFESISAKQISSFNWGSHIEGAIQLVQARGRKQIKTRIGLQLFIAVRTLMTIYCLSVSKEPQMSANWWLDDTTFSKTAQAMQRLMIRTSEIRARAAQLIDRLGKSPEHSELMLEMIRTAQAADQQVVAWQEALPADWRGRAAAWEDSVPGGDYARAEVFPGRVDVYGDVWIGSVVNSGRAVRLILHSIIVRCAAWVCAPVDYRTTPEYATAAGVCRDAITDIIASVPYFLGWHLGRKDLAVGGGSKAQQGEGEGQKFGNFACGQEDCAKGLAGYLVTWPLTCLISQDYATDAQRAWVLGRLRKIGSELGVKYALAMCQLQMRVPSLLIRRDALLKTYPAVSAPDGFAKVVAARLAPPSAGHALNPQQQWEAVQKLRVEQGKAELIEKLVGSVPQDESTRLALAARGWLKI